MSSFIIPRLLNHMNLYMMIIMLCVAGRTFAEPTERGYTDPFSGAVIPLTPSANTNDRISHLEHADMTEVVKAGFTPYETAFIFAWYRDTYRLRALLDNLREAGTDVRTLRFGKKSIAFTSDNTRESWTLLHVAILRLDIETAKMLEGFGLTVEYVEQKAAEDEEHGPLDILAFRPFGALKEGAENGSIIEMAKYVVSRSSCIPSRRVLLKAIRWDNVDLVREMLNKGANPDDTNAWHGDGLSPLESAKLFGASEEMIELLDKRMGKHLLSPLESQQPPGTRSASDDGSD